MAAEHLQGDGARSGGEESSDELGRARRELERLAYAASHDLAEPLRIAAGYLKLLRQRSATELGPEAKKYLERADESIARMQEMIGDMLRYSRITTRGGPMEPIDPALLVAGAVAGLGSEIERRGAEIETGPMPPVRGDRGQLEWLFRELIGNAIRFCAVRPRISIAARSEGQRVAFRVADNGIGIDPRAAERVFELFQRLHTREEYPGRGAGLAICRRIVERHGGCLKVEPGIPDGSLFLFDLPEGESGIRPGPV